MIGPGNRYCGNIRHYMPAEQNVDPKVDKKFEILIVFKDFKIEILISSICTKS